jgi:hypothetical protein
MNKTAFIITHLQARSRTVGLPMTAAAVLILIAMLFVFPPALNTARMQDLTPTPDPVTAFGGLNVQTQLYNLTFSTTPDGPAMTYFPAGTQQIFARFNYLNVPSGVVLRRDWYNNGALFIQNQEVWDGFTLGTTGRLSRISIYDFADRLTPGYYNVVIYVEPNSVYPAAQVVGDFVIADYPATAVPAPGNARFSDLTMSTSAAGASVQFFPQGTALINARWNYSNIPVGAVLRREWYIDNVLYKVREETWSAYWGTHGRLTHIALYDYTYGLPMGMWRLVVYLRDMPNVRAEVNFQIGGGDGPGPNVYFNNLTFSNEPEGAPAYLFPRGTAQVYARWDFYNIPAGAVITRRWYRNGVLWLERVEPWYFGANGRVNSISIYDFDTGLPSGGYYVEMELSAYPGVKVFGSFEIQ